MADLIANRPMCGDFGNVNAEQEFSASESDADSLVRRGLARYAKPPKIQYSTKVVTPEAPEVSADPSFRDVPVRDEKPKEVAPAGDPALSSADAPEPGTAHPKRRGGRPRSGSGK